VVGERQCRHSAVSNTSGVVWDAGNDKSDCVTEHHTFSSIQLKFWLADDGRNHDRVLPEFTKVTWGNKATS
jgi:hypothetical protein